jgi:hypothetical protein
MTCHALYMDTVTSVLQVAMTRGKLPGSWKFASVVRAGISYFFESDLEMPRHYRATGLDMSSGDIVPGELVKLPFAARDFARNSHIAVYCGPLLPVDQLAQSFYRVLGTANVPEFCQIGLDRPLSDTESPSGLREHTELTFVGFDADPSDLPLGTSLDGMLVDGPPPPLPHWCLGRMYRPGRNADDRSRGLAQLRSPKVR